MVRVRVRVSVCKHYTNLVYESDNCQHSGTLQLGKSINGHECKVSKYKFMSWWFIFGIITRRES